MIQVSHSPLLQALGYAIINSLWQFALLWLVYILANSIFKFTSQQRYLGTLSLQLVGFFWFVVTAVFYYGECLNSENVIFTVDALPVQAPSDYPGFKEMFFTTVLKAELLLPYLSLAYLLLVMALSFKMVKSYRHTQVLRYSGLQKIDVNWRLFVNRISGQLGIKRTVRIYISNIVQSPVTIGFLKPLVLLPAAVVNNLNTEQIEAILIHELAHIKRNDYLVNIIVSIIEVTLFFNPFMQLISKQMKHERENSCDDWVLQYEYNACNYAKALLKIATYKNCGTEGFALQAVGNRRALLIRVKRMIEKKDLYNTYRQQLVSLIFITGAITSLAWFAPKNYPQTKLVVSLSEVQLKAEPLVARVENPLFNPIFFLAEDSQAATTTPVAVNKETSKTPEASFDPPVIKAMENEIVEKFSVAKTEQPIVTTTTNVVHTVNLVLDSALFENYATKALVVSEIKKLKEEFEMLNGSSSLFQNVDWKEFWNNTKVQKQLETAFEQLKSLENEKKYRSLAMAAVNRTVGNPTEITNAESDLKVIASRRLAQIVKERISDLRQQQASFDKLSSEINIQIDLPDFSQFNVVKDNGPWSFTYVEKPRVAVRAQTSAKNAEKVCSETKERKKVKASGNELQTAPNAEEHKEILRHSTQRKSIRIIRI